MMDGYAIFRVLSLLLGLNLALVAQTVEHRPGEYLVSLEDGVDAHFLLQRADPAGTAERVSILMNVWLLRSLKPEQEMLSWLRRLPEVRVAQFNHLIEERGCSSNIFPDDPLFPLQWHLFNNGTSGGVFDADLDAEQAWEISTGGLSPEGDTIVIAVIDGGVQISHPDLSANLWRNRAEIPNNGLDDDQNGYVDDYLGWNVFTQNDNIHFFSAHGTPVSAVLGARGNNGVGITGVNWTTKIMFVAAGATEDKVLAAFDYVLQSRRRYSATGGKEGAFVVALNCSWGINFGQAADAPLWCAAYDSLGVAGIVSVAATANLPVNVDEVGDLPTTCSSNYLISVTSLNSSDQFVDNAAWGKEHIDLGAYGLEVYTAASGSNYGYFSGTSFAAPQVAGAVGLLYAAPCPNLVVLSHADPSSAAYWARSLILENISPNPGLQGLTQTDGRLNLYRTLQAYENQCGTCPAPFALRAELQGNYAATLHWLTTPATLTVNLRWRTFGQGVWNTVFAAPDSFWLGDLEGCKAYEFSLQSVCEKGITSGWSPSLVFLTDGCCTAPETGFVESKSETSAQLAWAANSPVGTYVVRFRESNGGQWTYQAVGDNMLMLNNLKSCTSYQWQVQSGCGEWNSGFSTMFAFVTLGCGSCTELQYCSGKSKNASFEWIESVQIGDWAHHSGLGGSGYQNFCYQQNRPELGSGSSVPVTITPGFSGTPKKEYYRIYVDYNQDGLFDEVNELAFDSGFALEGPATGMLEVPETLVPGLTRIRVMMKFIAPNDSPPSACTDFDFGQVEDYCAELLQQLPSSVKSSADTSMEIRVYPQPAREWAVLEFAEGFGSEGLAVQLLDLSGRTALTLDGAASRDGRVLLDIGHLASGLYLIQVTGGGETLRGKLLKV